MNKSFNKKPLLRFKFEGSAIRNNTILFDDLSTFISNISIAIDRLIHKSLQKDTATKRGRPTKAMQILSALEIVSVRRGCFRIGLDLRRNGQQFPQWDIGEEATDKLIVSINAIAKDKQVPDEVDQSILIPLRDAGKIIDRGVDNIYINSNSSFGHRKLKYESSVREKIINRINRYQFSYTTVEGRLLMLDVEEDKLRCRLQPSTGEPIGCTFDEDIAEQIMRYPRQFIRAKGDAKYDFDTGKMALLHVKDVEPIAQLSLTDIPQVPLSSFWREKTFEELAREQSVYPVGDLHEMASDWPEDTDFDTFFEAVRSSRN